jgi:hypothetical protein
MKTQARKFHPTLGIVVAATGMCLGLFPTEFALAHCTLYHPHHCDPRDITPPRPPDCNVACRATFPQYYDPLVSALRWARAEGQTDYEECWERLANNSSALAGVVGLKVGGRLGGAIAYAVTKECVRCACNRVW